MRIGLISDTHGLLRSEVFTHFADVELILHAGDIGPESILLELETIAPVAAVWGNTDGFDIRSRVDEVVEREVAGRMVVVVHGHQLESLSPGTLVAAWPDAGIIVHGHTHRQAEERIESTLIINPGGAGAPRFGLRPSVAMLELGQNTRVQFLDVG